MNIISTKYRIHNDEFLLKQLCKYTSCEFFYKYKENISLYFVFFNLYNNTNEPINSRLYYNDICAYYKNKYSIEHITKVFDNVYFNKINRDITSKNIYQVYCDKKCSICPHKDICY